MAILKQKGFYQEVIQFTAYGNLSKQIGFLISPHLVGSLLITVRDQRSVNFTTNGIPSPPSISRNLKTVNATFVTLSILHTSH